MQEGKKLLNFLRLTIKFHNHHHTCMHNCQRIDWISSKELFRHHLLLLLVHSCKYHNNFYVLQFFYSRNSKWNFFYVPYYHSWVVWFKVAFFHFTENSHLVRRPKRLPWVTFSDYVAVTWIWTMGPQFLKTFWQDQQQGVITIPISFLHRLS